MCTKTPPKKHVPHGEPQLHVQGGHKNGLYGCQPFTVTQNHNSRAVSSGGGGGGAVYLRLYGVRHMVKDHS